MFDGDEMGDDRQRDVADLSSRVGHRVQSEIQLEYFLSGSAHESVN